MKRILTLACLCMPLISYAAPPATPQDTKRQEECAKEAGGKTVDARPQFMLDCTGGATTHERATGAQDAQHAKEKACTTEARQKPEGAERARYMRQCMEKKE